MKKHISAVLLVAIGAAMFFARAAVADEHFAPAYETVMGRLGSRFFVNPQPQKLSWKQSPMGVFMDTDESFYCGVSVDGQAAALPFQKEIPRTQGTETAITMTSSKYRADTPSGVAVEMKLVAPFYPRDERLSSAPFVYVYVTLTNKSAAKKAGTFFLGETFDRKSKVGAGKVSGEKSAAYEGLLIDGSFSETPGSKVDLYAHPERYKKTLTRQGMFLLEPAGGAAWYNDRLLPALMPGTSEKPGKRSAGFTMPFDLAPGASRTVIVVLAAYVRDNYLFGKEGKNYVFKYTQLFPDIESVAAFAANSRAEIMEKTGRYDALVSGMSLQESYKNFLAYAFQSWIINTVWAKSGTREWFSELEGECLWNSTVDVSYNTALIYYELWPELLKMQLDEWPDYTTQGGKVILHDMGRLQDITGTAYSMPVEENANYILMLHHYLVVTGDVDFVKAKMPLVRKLVDFIIECDTNGDGFPEEGNYNTYERHLPNPLGGQGVVYVAVKAYAGVRAAEELSTWTGDSAYAAKCRGFIGKFTAAFDKKAWDNDHYVICLQDTIAPGQITRRWSLPRSGFPTGSGVYDDTIARSPGSDTNAESVPLKYHDAYTILTSNGLLYLLRSASPPDLDMDRIKEDLYNATVFTWRESGNPHTGDPDDKGSWLSANIWRDMTAAYLGLDWSANFDAYWPAAAFTTKGYNEGVFADSHFYDTDPYKPWDLRYYPRGATAFGVPDALAGLRLDYPAKTVHLRPLRDDLHVPLFMFVDWEKGAIPWLTSSRKDGAITADVSEKQLLGGWKMVVDK